MSSPDLNNLDAEIQLQQSLRQKMTQIDSARDEFLAVVEKVRTEYECLRNFKALLEDLNTERLALVNELRHINTDINLIEQTIKQSESNHQKILETARKVYLNDLIPLRGEINEIRDAMGKERLPATLVDNRDLEEVFPTDHKPNGATEMQFDQPNLATIWPFAVACGAQNAYGSQLEALRQANVLNIMAVFGSRMQQSAMLPAEEATGDPGNQTGALTERSASALTNDGGQAGAASFGHLDPLSGLGSLPKQQQPPMKTCTSCQQQIHRNAPICPLCKSKSRSRHPKKKQRQTKSDDQQE